MYFDSGVHSTHLPEDCPTFPFEQLQTIGVFLYFHKMQARCIDERFGKVTFWGIKEEPVEYASDNRTYPNSKLL